MAIVAKAKAMEMEMVTGERECRAKICSTKAPAKWLPFAGEYFYSSKYMERKVWIYIKMQ